MHVVATTPTDLTDLNRSYSSVSFGLPRVLGGLASVLTVAE
jgi:hypothetical protein